LVFGSTGYPFPIRDNTQKSLSIFGPSSGLDWQMLTR
jgi:hypothetical protein